MKEFLTRTAPFYFVVLLLCLVPLWLSCLFDFRDPAPVVRQLPQPCVCECKNDLPELVEAWYRCLACFDAMDGGR